MANLTTVLDMVKVMAFALQEGKIAVHCHAGLGRTGKFVRNVVKSVLSFQESLIVHLQNLTHNEGSHLSSLQVCCWQVSWPMLPG